MSRIQRSFGLDGIDLAIHAGVTVALMLLGYQATTNGNGPAIILSLSLLLLGVRRHFAWRRQALANLEGAAAERLAELEGRMADMEQMHGRLVELEERLDFAERLLSNQPALERLPPR